ncbi:uncharacterized protein LOC144628090 isoform X2 [Oculina patagonica]
MTLLAFWAFFLELSIILSVTMAAVDDCSNMEYWNGTHCASCSSCPRGYGVKTKCSSKQNTECHRCWPGFDYSNTTGFDGCIECDKYSNCLPGNPKKIKNCTIYSPPVCDGCADGNFFDPNSGHGGCVECSPPCNILEDETRSCSTAHDRKCTPKSTEPTTRPGPVLSNNSKGSAKEIPNSSDDGSKVQPEDPALAAGGTESPASTPLVQKAGLWVGVGVGILIIAIALVVVIIRRKSNRRKHDVNARTAATRGEEMQQRTPLMPSAECGLDLPIKNLSIDERRFIAQRLNGRYYDGYFYWALTAEKLGLRDECESWKMADNPTEKFLKAYGEKAGSTIGNLIKVLRDPKVELTQIAKEIEEKFSPQDQGEPPKHPDDTSVNLELDGQGEGDPGNEVDTNV